MLNTAYLTI